MIGERIIAEGLGILDKFIPDTNERKAAKEELQQKMLLATNAAAIAQMEINKTEAAHPSVFVSGWRPMCGWICASALGYNFIASPLLAYFLVIGYPEAQMPPSIELGPLMTVLLGMLGLGGLRTYEKSVGVARGGWGPRSLFGRGRS